MKLHLGCGRVHIPGYTHVDVVKYPHVDICHHIEHLPMIGDGMVDVVYVSHVLEHFKRAEISSVLDEWFRVLRNTGTLRVAVPDFAVLCTLYQETGDLELITGPVCGRQDTPYNTHYTIFDEKTLSSYLRAAGFSFIRQYDWWETEHAHIDDYSQAYYPHMDKADGTLISLNVECTKGAIA